MDGTRQQLRAKVAFSCDDGKSAARRVMLLSLCCHFCVLCPEILYSYCPCAMTILMIEFSLAVWKHPNMAMHAPVSLLSDRARYVSAYTGHYNYLLSPWALLSRYLPMLEPSAASRMLLQLRSNDATAESPSAVSCCSTINSATLPCLSSDGDAAVNTSNMISTFYFCFSSLVLKQRDSIQPAASGWSRRISRILIIARKLVANDCKR